MSEMFPALIVEEGEEKTFTRRVGEKKIDDLPAGELLVRVEYSSLNYKDALSASGNRGVTRNYPHTPGIDAAGVVQASDDAAFQPGDEVIVIGYDLGMNSSGGFGRFIRVPSGWAVKKPADLTLRESMIYGTAGFTAAQSVQALVNAGVMPEDGPVAVSGATGGVGSVAVGLLAKLGYEVTAATGKQDAHAYLKVLGASHVVDRAELDDDSGRPMLKTRWAGAIDTVGGNTLATLLKTVHYGGAVTACGLVAGSDLPTTVFPFILRGISLLGIDSVNCSIAERYKIWDKLSDDWKLSQLDALAKEVDLHGLNAEIDLILKGQQRGRVLVRLG